MAGLALALGGCSLLPGAGPSARSVVNAAEDPNSVFALVELAPEVLSLAGQYRGEGIGVIGGRGPAPEVLLGIGDVVSVTIFEAAPGGLFIPVDGGNRAGNFVELPDQTVDAAGNIAVPYVGAVQASNRSIPSIQDEIVERLPDRAIDPQVVISVVEQKSTQVSVLGAVNAPARFAINPSGDRVLDAIARAGGPEFPGYETIVTVQRDGNEASERFNRLVNAPEDNVFVRPGDIIVVSRRPETFVALGAAGENGQFDFGAVEITLAEALGKAGGMLDNRADPTYLFVYRLEPRAVLAQMGKDITRFGGAELIPTIYKVDLREPEGYFLASHFGIRDKDVVYIANAPIVDLAKIFQFVTGAAESTSATTTAAAGI